MRDEKIRQALRTLERVESPVGVADALFERLLDELKEERLGPTAAAPSPKRRFSRRILIPAAAVLAVIALLTAALVFLPPQRSALAVIQQARQKFRELPPYHATTRLLVNDNAASPDFELVYETEDWYKSITKWRTEITSSSTEEEGNFRVADGRNIGSYGATINTFHLKPIAETDDPEVSSPSYFYNPSFQWWSSGRPEKPKPSDKFFAENCESTETEYLGRSAAHLTCRARPEPIEIWIDKQTGMLLKVRFFDIVREITSIDFAPDFEPGVFETKPPPEAFLRWEGKGDPPPGYETKLGESVVATYEGGLHGASQFVVGAKDLWFTSMTTDEGPYTSQIHRMDPRNGKHLAKVVMPDGVQVAGMVELGGYLWVLENLQPDAQREAALQRLDLRTNKLIDPVIRLGTSPTGIAAADAALWATAGEPRQFRVGRAEGEFIPISRVDPQTFEVTSFDIGLTPIGALVEQQGSLFTAGLRPNRSGESSDFVLVRFDIAQRRISGEVVLDSFPNAPNAPVAGFGSIWLTTSDAKANSFVNRIDAATLQTTKIPSGKGSGSIAIGGDLVWVSNYHEDAVVKIDPKTNQIIGKLTIGPAPGPIAAGFGSLWVGFGNLERRQIARVVIE